MTKKRKEEILKEIVEYSQKFVGVPYKYGAKMEEAPHFFDCSSFVKYVYEQFGFFLPRSTILQAEFLRKTVKSLDDLREGDLLYLHGTRGYYTKKFPQGIGHVAIYLGDGKVIHADGSSKKPGVKIEKMEKVIERKKPLVVIKRVV
ncbi:MAG: hypothetical protein KatS3mg098_198 [Candidatus Parcubacteria bacterium]|nr:MAG: hypothetical protein KatS3mg098_198 [Candidatus Parcubacteria bacterium]